MESPQGLVQLALQVLSYHGEVHLQIDDLRVFAIQNGRCSVCGCSAFRHDLLYLYPPRCRHECPTSTLRALNSADLVSLSMPQICRPDSPLPRLGDSGGPIKLELREDTTGTGILMEAPKVTYPRLDGPVTRASKRTLYEMQDQRCNACFEKKRLDDLTNDHRIPKSRSGQWDMANAELMCAPCNRAKGNKAMAQFLWKRWKHRVQTLPTHMPLPIGVGHPTRRR